MAVKFISDPESILDFTLDWTEWLTTTDTIVHAKFFPDPGLKIVAQGNTTHTATVWLSGGAAGSTYDVVCHITTSTGRQDDRTFQLVVRET